MKKKIIYVAIAIVIFLLGILVGVKLASKDKKEENVPETKIGTIETVVFDISLNHARKENDQFIEDWMIMRNQMAIQKGDTISSMLYKNDPEGDTLIKNVDLKEESVTFQLKVQEEWKTITLKYNENYKYLSKEYQYTNITVRKVNIDGYKKLSSDILLEKKYYEAEVPLEHDEKVAGMGEYDIKSLEELRDISNEELVSNYQNYDFKNNSLFVIKSYGNRENNCYRRDNAITMLLSKEDGLHLVQEHIDEAETDCIIQYTDIQYRVFELKGKYATIKLDSIDNYLQ